jgi:fatty acid desaturase
MGSGGRASTRRAKKAAQLAGAIEVDTVEKEPLSEPAPLAETRTEARKSSKSLSKQKKPLLKPGLNHGLPGKRLYQEARIKVLEREAEMAERNIPFSGGHKFKREKENDYKCVKYYHYLHGKVYDLREFYSKHPGGDSILKMTAGLPDATSMFESYHAFADRDNIMKRLQKYEVTAEMDAEAVARRPAQLFSFEQDGFYMTLLRRVRAKFGATKPGQTENINANVKANQEWVIKVGTQMGINLICYMLAFVFRLPTVVAMVFAFLAGWFQIQWGFTVFHDASHFAIGPRNHWANAFFTRLWAAFSLWEGRTWIIHHTVLHHSYTGSPSLDPDVQHAQPMVRKSPDVPARKDNGFFAYMGDKFGMAGWGAAATLIYVFLPGMWFGQARVYAMYALARFSGKGVPKELCAERLWGMPKYKDTKGYSTQWWEYVIYTAVILVQIVRLNPLVTFAYFVSLNLFYSMCIVADHDLAESAITNHIDFEPTHQHHDGCCDGATPSPTNEKKEIIPDWGAMQVMNTTNFRNNRLNLFGNLHGNINWQIEHHLLPGMCHIHLPKIATIVRETSEEFGISYVTYPSLSDAWYSFLITLRAVMTKKDNDIGGVQKMKRLWTTLCGEPLFEFLY